jgi:hypothetical protein
MYFLPVLKYSRSKVTPLIILVAVKTELMKINSRETPGIVNQFVFLGHWLKLILSLITMCIQEYFLIYIIYWIKIWNNYEN